MFQRKLYLNITTAPEKALYTTNLRKVGGSVMLALPPAILELLQLRSGASVGVSIDEGRLVVTPNPRPRYRLAELIAECDAAAELNAEDRDGLASPAVGNEIL
jgi:antitoxin ChpS